MSVGEFLAQVPAGVYFGAGMFMIGLACLLTLVAGERTKR